MGKIGGASPYEKEPELVTCPNCSRTNASLAHFCTKCGAPLSALANIGPWETTLSEGFAYRQAVSGPPKTITLIGMWLLFGPALIGAVFLLLSRLQLTMRNGFVREELGMLAGMLLLGVISGILLFRTTRNYIRQRQMIERTSGDDSSTRAGAGPEPPQK